MLFASSQGVLKRLKTVHEIRKYKIKNFFSLGAYLSRTQNVVYYSLVAFSLEANNPFQKCFFKRFFLKKMMILDYLHQKIPFFRSAIATHIDLFKRNSLLQQKIIDQAQKVVLYHRGIVFEAKEALAKGIYPILITSGSSGAYWMRNQAKEVIGIFKPYDEEVFALNNPLGPLFQGPMGTRKMRLGVRVGETMYREVAAYLIDQFFGFGLVPKTYYARFEHPLFFMAKEESYRKPKQKIGSFQEVIEGFMPMYKLDNYQINLEDVQLLFLLDIIIGNLDRNSGNILINGAELAAIDHGLSFSDLPEELSLWYWKSFVDEKQHMHDVFVKFLNEFPFLKISHILQKKCHFTVPVLRRMKERIVLFRSGVNLGLTFRQLEALMRTTHLEKLVDYDNTLEERAHNEVNRVILEF